MAPGPNQAPDPETLPYLARNHPGCCCRLLQGYPNAGLLRRLPGGERIVSQHARSQGSTAREGHQGSHPVGDGRERSGARNAGGIFTLLAGGTGRGPLVVNTLA